MFWVGIAITILLYKLGVNMFWILICLAISLHKNIEAKVVEVTKSFEDTNDKKR